MLITLLGFITGILIGLTGTGGGVLLTPLLLLFTPFPALVIIGTDIVNGAVTKLVGVFEHRRLGQVKWNLARFLIAGSLPGTVAGILLIGYLKNYLGANELDRFLRVFLGVTMLGVSLLLPAVRGGNLQLRGQLIDATSKGDVFKLAAAGSVIGFLVALTSVGSGSLLMIFLLLFVPLPFAELVGTDILFGLITMAVAGTLHLWMGHFSLPLFLKLIVGAAPGVVIGSRLTRAIPERYSRWLYSVLYFLLGVRLLVG